MPIPIPTPKEVISTGYKTIPCIFKHQCAGCAFDYIVPREAKHLCDYAECGLDLIYIEVYPDD